MRFSICNETYVDWPFERVCDDVAACGYDAVEIAPSTLVPDPTELTEEHAREVGERAQRAGLDVVGLHWLLKAPDGLHLTTADSSVRARTVEYLCHLARLCAEMGGSVMVLGSPQQRNVIEGEEYENAFSRAADGCRTVAETAAELGVVLALEPLAPAYTNFLTRASEAVRLIETVDHPGCRLHLDVLAMSSEESAPAEIIRESAQQLVHFHANDTSLGGPGTGDVDYVPIVTALQEIGYDGFVSVEVFDFEPGGAQIARESIEFLRRAFGASSES